MKNYCEQIKPHWDLELAAAARAESDGDPHLAFRHFSIAFMVMVLILLVRPQGLFGQRIRGED